LIVKGHALKKKMKKKKKKKRKKKKQDVNRDSEPNFDVA
jgi:hypothetical protein